MEQDKIRHPLIKVFFTSFALFLISIVPILIASKGVYIWCGDYEDQTIPFIEHIHRLLHSKDGLPVYDWYSLLGMDLMTSNGDHLFSPFDWLLYLLPQKIVPYAHSVFMAVKIGLASVTAYIYCRQYVKKDRSAFICGLLYAFSGFQLFNLVYQFSDRYLLFPLLLYSFDQLVIYKKPLCFALLLGLNNLMSFYFCWIICVNIAIYYIVRTVTGSFPRLDIKLFLRLAAEVLLGLGSGMVSMLPCILVLIGNNRVSDLIFGHSLLIYENDGVILRIIQSMFLPPEICRVGWYFKDVQLSLSPPLLFIPLFTVIGVVYVWRRNKKEWYSVLLTVCAVIACVPVLNSVFSAFNNSYYARWYFMPLLIMIMMTGMYIDDIEAADEITEFRICAAITGFWALYGIYSVYFEKPAISEPSMKNLWLRSVIIAVSGLVVMYLLRHPEPRLRAISARNIKQVASVFCLVPFLSFSFSLYETDYGEYIPNEVSSIWNDFEPVELEKNEFYRTSTVTQLGSNKPMMWDLPSVNFFNSMITADTCSFFESVGVPCAQNVGLTRDDHAVCRFLSVKYDLYFNKPMTGDVQVEPEYLKKFSMPGFDQKEVINRYIVYENNTFIPMGYTFDYYMHIEEEQPDFGDEESRGIVVAHTGNDEPVTDPKEKQKLLLKAIWLTDEQIAKYGGILDELPEDMRDDTSDEAYMEDCKARAASACYEFIPNNSGFDARIDLAKDDLVFFSVPYSDGFTAFVDGEQTEIERVFSGLCAIYVPQGDHSIEFRYETPGLRTGCIISFVSLLFLGIYTMADLIFKRKGKCSLAA